MQSIETMLRGVPGFAQLDGESRQFLADTAELAEAEAGDELFREGALPESLYVLLDGRVMLTGTAADAATKPRRGLALLLSAGPDRQPAPAPRAPRPMRPKGAQMAFGLLDGTPEN